MRENMKKVLFATTALVLTAGMAAAEVKLSGTARAGLVYQEDRGPGIKDTQVNYRLRFNIDASKELDSGVTLGGRIRMQSTQNQSGGGASLASAYIYAQTSGFRVEVGNANTAFDSMATLYNSELGYVGTTQGSYNSVNGGDYASYSSGPYGSSQQNRVGIFASYEVGGLVARLSYVTPDQVSENLAEGTTEEFGVSVDYTTGAFSVGAGYVANANFVDGVDGYAITGEYALNDTTNIGLHVVGTSSDVDTVDDNTGVTLYGTTELSGVGLGAFISTDDTDGLENDVAYGIGASYDLGGATLAGTIQQGFDEDIYADVGITFSF